MGWATATSAKSGVGHEPLRRPMLARLMVPPSSSSTEATRTRSSASVALLDHILSVARLVVALAVAQLIIVRCRCQRRSPLESARQPRLPSSWLSLLSLSPEDDAFFADAAETEARGHQSEEERAGVCVARVSCRMTLL